MSAAIGVTASWKPICPGSAKPTPPAQAAPASVEAAIAPSAQAALLPEIHRRRDFKGSAIFMISPLPIALVLIGRQTDCPADEPGAARPRRAADHHSL